MSTSAVTICNLALARLGQTQYLTALTNTTPAGRFCGLFYDMLRDEVLSSMPWPFAQAFATLALRSDPDEAANDEWQYEYSLPSDCLVARHIVTSSRLPPFPTFEIGQASGVRVIWTDEAEAVLRYSARVEDPQRWPPSFSDALAWRLAAELAMPLGVKPALRQFCDTEYRAALRVAGAQAFNEGQPDDLPPADMIAARG